AVAGEAARAMSAVRWLHRAGAVVAARRGAVDAAERSRCAQFASGMSPSRMSTTTSRAAGARRAAFFRRLGALTATAGNQRYQPESPTKATKVLTHRHSPALATIPVFIIADAANPEVWLELLSLLDVWCDARCFDDCRVPGG